MGEANGEISLYDLKTNNHGPTSYRYHREGILDVCWLSLHEKEEERTFISASPENYLYMCFYSYLDGTNASAIQL